MIPAVVLSGHTTALGVIRSLGKMGVPIINVYYQQSDMGQVSKYVKERILSPHPEKHEKEFISLLLDHSCNQSKRVLIPADDATLSVVSKNLKILENRYFVACTGWQVAEQFIDKKHTYALAEHIGVPAPRTLIPMSEEDVKEFASRVDYPCLVKPRQSHLYFEVFRKKMVKVENYEEMLAAFREAAGAGIEVMLQEYIPGDDTRGVNYNSYFWGGRALLEFTAEKVRLSPPGFGVPSVVISKEIAEVAESGQRILRAMGFQGYACTEFKRDPRDGVYKLMEVNGRHNRSALLALNCGINFPWFEYRHLTKGKIPADPPTAFLKNIYWIDEFKDVGHLAGSIKNIRYLWPFAQPYVARHVFAVFALNDLKPFLKRCLDTLKMLISILCLPGKYNKEVSKKCAMKP